MLVTVETMRRAAKLSVATLLLAVATAMPVGATPIYNTCNELGGDVGYYQWEVDEYGNYTDAIYVDTCALDGLGAGPTDYQRVLEHEWGHADGLTHSSDPSDTMYPVIVMQGT